MTVDLPPPRLRPEIADGFRRAWVSFADPAVDAHRIRVDLTWLLSRWGCVFGRGCPGVAEDRPDDGCCSHGAYLTDVDDEHRVDTAAARLDATTWQLRREVWAETVDPDPEDPDADEGPARRTALVDGACVFLNRPGFPAGAGCALHALALREGGRPLDTKPDVCWQLPVRREQHRTTGPDGTPLLVTTLGEYDRAGWGPGGADLAWWCTSSPDAHGEVEPLYRSYAAELTALIGPRAYAVLARLCAHREARGTVAVHPATAAAAAMHPATAATAVAAADAPGVTARTCTPDPAPSPGSAAGRDSARPSPATA